MKGIHDSVSGERFIREASEYSKDDAGHLQRTEILMSLGKLSMDAWQDFYNKADDELKRILEDSNFNPCRELTDSKSSALHDGYRIDLLYNIPDAKYRADGMRADYEKLGYKHCKILSPTEVIKMDPALTEFCMSHSEAKDPENPNMREWNGDTVALFRPGGCINTRIFLPKFYAYLTKQMGKYANDSGQTKDCFRIKFDRKVSGIIYDNTVNSTKIIGLQLPNKVQKNKHDYNRSDYVFAPGEAVGTLESLGFKEPAYARFAGASLILDIPFDPSQLSADSLENFRKFNHCMEVHQEGIVLAWQGRCLGNKIFIGVAGTKSFYADQAPDKDQAFAKDRNLLQLNMVNDVLPEFISIALGRNTKGQKLTEADLQTLEQHHIARRWVGTRAVAYDGFPTLGNVYNASGKVSNARVTTGLGSGGVSFSHGAIKVSRAILDEKHEDGVTQKTLVFGSLSRTMFAGPTKNFPNNDFKQMAEKLLNSDLKVTVNSIAGSQIKGIKDLIREAKIANKPLILTFTPGPFKTADELPKGWMDTPSAVGCTAQLSAFEKEIKQLNAVVYAVNKQSSDYQCGPSGLLAVKKLHNLQMISDENGLLVKELGLTTFAIGNKHYIERFTMVIKPNGEICLFELSGPVNDAKAKDHVTAIARFLDPTLDKRVESVAAAAAAAAAH